MSEHPKVSQQLSDPISENLQKLATLFPAAVKDGELDIEALREELGDFAEIQPGDEKYELNWAGKQAAKKEAFKPLVGKTLKYVEEDSKHPDTTENIYIEGDNLEALKLLRQNYYGSIKMIYIDPPYNTGEDFIYSDNFVSSQSKSDLLEGNTSETGDRLTKNESSSNRFHARWLDMIYPRMKLAKDLLSEDGVIFISIDENEINNLRKICDEVFGEQNHITTLHVQMSSVQGQKVKAAKKGNIVKNAEYIVLYGKLGNKAIAKNLLYETALYDSHYSLYLEPNGDNFTDKTLSSFIMQNAPIVELLTPLGFIKNDNITNDNIAEAYNSNKTFRNFIHSHSSSIVSDDKTSSLTLPPTLKLEPGTVVEHKAEGRSYLITVNSRGTIRQRIKLSEKIKQAHNFLQTYGCTTIRGDWWPEFHKDMGNVSKEGNITFANGKKPKRLIKQLAYMLGIQDGDTILDFFAGSATTAHSIMELNSENFIKSHFIMVQEPAIPELENEPTNFSTIAEIGKERIHRAGEKIKAELVEKHQALLNEDGELELDDKAPETNPYILNPDALDIGFKVFRIEDTQINWLKKDLSGGELVDADISSKDQLDFVPGFTDLDVVYEIMLRQSSIPLTQPITTLTDIGSRTYLYGESYLICLEEDITKAMVEQLAQLEPTPLKFIFRDSAFGKDIAFKDETFRRLNAEIAKHTDGAESYTVEFI